MNWGQVPERTCDVRWSVQLLGKERQDLVDHDDHHVNHDRGAVDDVVDDDDDDGVDDDDDLPALTMAWFRKKDAAAPAAANRA